MSETEFRGFRRKVAAVLDHARTHYGNDFEQIIPDLDALLAAHPDEGPTPATPPTWADIRKLPSPWTFDEIDRAPCMSCDWCDAYIELEHRKAPLPPHPQNYCLWARAHTPVQPETPREGTDR